MVKDYILKYLVGFFLGTFAILIIGGWVIFLLPQEWQFLSAALLFIGLLIYGGYYAHNEIISEIKRKADQKTEQAKVAIEQKETELDAAKTERDVLKKTIIEKSSGFPTLLSYIEAYEKLVDDYISGYLIQKKHPAYKAAEVVKEETRRRREAEFLYRKTQSVIEYYQSIAPFLSEIEEELLVLEDDLRFSEYTDEESIDMTTRFLKKEEYRSLSVTDRNQLALDRYWSSRKRSKWLIGKMYERFIGFLYEQKGYQVEYFGIKEKYEDLGRDIIAKGGNKIYIVQCKNWSRYKTIYENHIFQLFGTTFEYNDRNKTKAEPVFFTTTKLSDIAREMCNKLGIKAMEGFPLKIYPSIKCNISRKTGEKIYHLPFDQQYDNTAVEGERFERYVMTVKEAENLGFRRAFRWHGEKK